MKKTQLISLILVGLLLAGCQTIKLDLDSVTPISPDYSYADGKFKNNISEISIEPQKLAGQPILFSDWWSSLSKTSNGLIVQDNYRNFKTALTMGIDGAGLSSPEGLYKLNVEEITETLPVGGVDIKCIVKIRYVARSRSGDEMFDEIVETEFASKFTDHLIGMERLAIACRGAWRKNFEVVIDRLVHSF